MNNDFINISSSTSKMNQQLIQEMIDNQLDDININNKLSIKDFKRIANNINSSIFDNDSCCIWKGYITKTYNGSKYINFYLNKRKTALHRLLYINFKNKLLDKQYIKFLCQNKGICCNINHINTCEKKVFKKYKKEINNLKPLLEKTFKNNKITKINENKSIILDFKN